jgi:hypothetical protein
MKQRVPCLILSLLLLLVLAACQSKREATQITLDERALSYETVISLVRSACDGLCPAYRVTLRGDGQVLYKGFLNVQTDGTAEGSVTPETVRQVLTRFMEIDFYSLQDQYINGEKGCPLVPIGPPSISISLSLDGKHKEVKVQDCWFSRDADELWALADFIDQATVTDRWVGARTPDP